MSEAYLNNALLAKYVEFTNKTKATTTDNLKRLSLVERAFVDLYFCIRSNAASGIEVSVSNFEGNDLFIACQDLDEFKIELGVTHLILPNSKDFMEFKLLREQFDFFNAEYESDPINLKNSKLILSCIPDLKRINNRVHMQIEEETAQVMFDMWAEHQSSLYNYAKEDIMGFETFRHAMWLRLREEYNVPQVGVKASEARRKQLAAGMLRIKEEPGDIKMKAGEAPLGRFYTHDILSLRDKLVSNFEWLLQNESPTSTPTALARLESALKDLAFMYAANGQPEILLPIKDVTPKNKMAALDAIDQARLHFGVKHFILPEMVDNDQMRILNQQMHVLKRMSEMGFVQSKMPILQALNDRIKAQADRDIFQLMMDCHSPARDQNLKDWYASSIIDFNWFAGKAERMAMRWDNSRKPNFGIAGERARHTQISDIYRLLKAGISASRYDGPSF